MRVTPLALPEILMVEPRVFGDDRGFLLEAYSQTRYQQAGIGDNFVQDNLSRSQRGVLRGLHFQHPRGQGKLVSVLEGQVYDVVLDVRTDSPRFGQWVGVELSSTNHRQLFVPAGFAHGFCVTSESALFQYKCSDFYSPQHEMGVAHDDPALAIAWPVAEPLISDKDRSLPRLRQIEPSLLPTVAAEST